MRRGVDIGGTSLELAGEPDHETSRTGSDGPGYTRRAVLATIVGAVPALVAGCQTNGESDESIPDPVTLEGKQCDYCSMIVEDHPGTSVQIFYRDDRPEDRDGPAWFCALHCAHNYHADRERLGWELVVRYATDYATVEYEIEVVEGAAYISSHVEREAFADVDDLQFVVGTGIEGAMGPEHVPFSDSDEAEAFADEHDGDVVDWETLEADVLSEG